MYLLKLLFTLSVCLLYERVGAKVKVVKYVYQRDMSEHCRRRVMPSVFLGQHVVEANSHILHFSQLEVPYSCFISIRTEYGNNIILVIQLDDHPPQCSDKKSVESPVKVFGMGETFGGYWGPLPDSILAAQTPLIQKFHTLKTTTQKPFDDLILINPVESDSDSDQLELISDPLPPTPSLPPGDTQEYIRKMIPLINITGHLEKSDKEPERAFAADDTFDLFYNVKRQPDEKYVSKMLPLMQFSVNTADESEELRSGGNNASTSEPRFDLEFDLGKFTIDPRLLPYPFSGNKPVALGKRYRPSVNRRVDFKKNKGRLFRAKTTPAMHKKQESNINESWPSIQSLLNNLTESNMDLSEKDKQFESERFKALMHRLADWQHNYSAYLTQNGTMNSPLFLDKIKQVDSAVSTSYHENKNLNVEYTNIRRKENDIISKTQTVPGPSNEYDSSTRLIKVLAGTPRAKNSSRISESSTKTNTHPAKSSTKTERETTTAKGTTTEKITNVVTPLTKQVTDFANKKDALNPIKPEVNAQRNTMATSKSTKFQRNEGSTTKSFSQTQKPHKEATVTSSVSVVTPTIGSIANHASWENVVQVAPKIAGILNHTSATTENIELTRKTSARIHKIRRRRRRKKRSIQAIPIEPARPHNLTTGSDILTTPEEMYNFVDIQDFARLVELQDDDIQGHLALRYMRRFVGATMFDLCNDRNLAMKQHVLFFNTSRIVLALTNFTLQRMTVIATPARWLPYSGQRCNINSLECQVAGKRVCVNKLIACDGVPNCGAQDIYDEDRLQCGGDPGLQHNVYLAAFTFLAVLLTMLYTVHYWLKRCVPQVSEAFFIYTDGTENILYLDSIMRSPLDTDDAKQIYHPADYFAEDLAIENTQSKKKTNILKRIFEFCCCKKQKLDDFAMVDMGLIDFRNREHDFSFPELEISNLTSPGAVEVAVQTGESLEMGPKDDKKENRFYDSFKYKNDNSNKDPRQENESATPRFGFRDIRTSSHLSQEYNRRTSESSELSMIKFLRDVKMNLSDEWSVKLSTLSAVREEPLREKELKSTVYERSNIQSNLSVDDSVDMPAPGSLKSELRRSPFEASAPIRENESLSDQMQSAQRRIRFNEMLTTIPQEEEESHVMREMSQLEPEMHPESSNATTGSMGREFRRFWTSNKSKKEKSKQKKHLPMH